MFHSMYSHLVTLVVVIYVVDALKYFSIVWVCSYDWVVASTAMVDCGSVGVHLVNVTCEVETSMWNSNEKGTEAAFHAAGCKGALPHWPCSWVTGGEHIGPID